MNAVLIEGTILLILWIAVKIAWNLLAVLGLYCLIFERKN